MEKVLENGVKAQEDVNPEDERLHPDVAWESASGGKEARTE